MSFSVNSALPTAGLSVSQAAASRPVESPPADNLMSALTTSDREVVYRATGRRVDENSKLVPMFAVQIALDRKSGYLSTGQDVSSAYLQAMATTYAGKENEQSFGAAIDKALSYLATQTPRASLDVTI
jgi:hypothetical protein